jgi:hypothetical protein
MGMGVAGTCMAVLVVALVALVRLFWGASPSCSWRSHDRGGRRLSRAAILTRRP